MPLVIQPHPAHSRLHDDYSQLDYFEEDKTAIIRVSDSGIGIPDKELKQLFEPFQRASNAAGFAGTGLGLAIVKQVVELHQGSVEVESKLGKGACFSIRIPLKQS